MRTNSSQTIVTTEDHLFQSVHALAVHHRNFPEVRAVGPSPVVAAARLAELLSLALDNAPSDWRREMIRDAIEDVRAFAGL